jgi:Dolichyl-phosphate-mannose-protein mannosyltransferase
MTLSQAAKNHHPCSGRSLFIVSLLLGLGLSLVGIQWGRYEDWNFDQMAFLGFRPNGIPYHYLKPPLHTYVTQFLAVDPVRWVFDHMPCADRSLSLEWTMICGHLLTVLMFCGSLAMVHAAVRHACGATPAAIIALVMATSAGLIQFNHYGTADSPLLFWMLASFSMAMRLSERGRLRDALAAGLLAGLAAADKYNGLGVAAAIPTALFIHSGWKCLVRTPLYAGSLAVVPGFILGNPGCILDHERFVRQFLYNLYTTPVYYGEVHRTGYLDFLICFRELIGPPASLLLALLGCASAFLLLKRRLTRPEFVLMAVSGIVFSFYFLTIGRFPRMEARFVLPAVPFALMLGAPAIRRIRFSGITPRIIVGGLLLYNLICCLWLGHRFLSDPRMDAQLYAMRHFGKGTSIESTYSPDWNLLPGLNVNIRKVICDSGFDNRFTSIFGKDNTVIREGLKDCGFHDPKDFFTERELLERHPDYVTFPSVTYVIAGTPETRDFYRNLEEGKYGYVKVFDKSSPRTPSWMYPCGSDALMDRMVILKKQ